MILIRDLFVSQNELRYIEPIPDMARYVKAGGCWSKTALEIHAAKDGSEPGRLIQISRIALTDPSVLPAPEGQKAPEPLLMIHDGHHRVVATHFAGRDHLREDEVEITDWTLESYRKADFSRGFVTPFDPITEVRTPDFRMYKDVVLALHATGPAGAAEQWCAANTKLYKTRRTFKAVFVLASRYLRDNKAIPMSKLFPTTEATPVAEIEVAPLQITTSTPELATVTTTVTEVLDPGVAGPPVPHVRPIVGAEDHIPGTPFQWGSGKIANPPRTPVSERPSFRKPAPSATKPIKAMGKARDTEEYIASLPQRNAEHFNMLVNRANMRGKNIDVTKAQALEGFFSDLLVESRENPPTPAEIKEIDRELGLP